MMPCKSHQWARGEEVVRLAYGCLSTIIAIDGMFWQYLLLLDDDFTVSLAAVPLLVSSSHCPSRATRSRSTSKAVSINSPTNNFASPEEAIDMSSVTKYFLGMHSVRMSFTYAWLNDSDRSWGDTQQEGVRSICRQHTLDLVKCDRMKNSNRVSCSSLIPSKCDLINFVRFSTVASESSAERITSAKNVGWDDELTFGGAIAEASRFRPPPLLLLLKAIFFTKTLESSIETNYLE